MYSAGFSASLQLKIFSVSASASLTVNSSGLACQASVDNFWFGPVYIQDAHLDVAWTANDKHLIASGRVKVLWWWVEGHVRIGSSGSASYSSSVAFSEMAFRAPSLVQDAALRTILHFPVFATYFTAISIESDAPPSNWQQPIERNHEATVHLSGAFEENVLSHLAAKVKEHISLVTQDVYISTPHAPSEYDINHQHAICESSHDALLNRIASLRDEFVRYRDKLERLASAQSAAAARHWNELSRLQATHVKLQRKYQHLVLRTNQHRERYDYDLNQARKNLQVRGIFRILENEFLE